MAKKAKKNKDFKIKAQVLLYPIVQTNFTNNKKFKSIEENVYYYFLTKKMINDYLSLYLKNNKDYKDKFVAPLHAHFLYNMPKSLIITAEYDPLRDEGYAYYKKLQRKMMIKSGVFIFVILLFACISAYSIYNRFKDTRDEILSSESLEVAFHNKEGNNVSLTKVNPVTDAVGLSSKSYTFTIKNNTNKKVRYVIKIKEDKATIEEDDCEGVIPFNIIKTGIHSEGEVSNIYNLDDLEDGIIVNRIIGAKKEINYTVRFWISQNSLAISNNFHFHGMLEVEEI